MIYKTTSCNSIIAKVITDFRLQSNNWKIDAPEWIGEGLRAIGHHGGFTKKYIKLKVRNHKVAIPCDLLEIQQIEYGNRPLPLGSSLRRGNYQPLVNTNEFVSSEFTLVDPDTDEVEYIHETTNFRLEGQYYELNPDFIQTSFESGDIVVYYTGYTLDSDGYPAVPDTYQHREALAFYILYKWLGQGNKHNTWDLKSAFDMWKDFRFKAQNKAIFPSIASMDVFANSWTRLVSNRTLPNSSFIGANQQQQFIGL